MLELAAVHLDSAVPSATQRHAPMPPILGLILPLGALVPARLRVDASARRPTPTAFNMAAIDGNEILRPAPKGGKLGTPLALLVGGSSLSRRSGGVSLPRRRDRLSVGIRMHLFIQYVSPAPAPASPRRDDHLPRRAGCFLR